MRSDIYRAALVDAVTCLRLNAGAAPFREICNFFGKENSKICDDEVKYQQGASQTLWQHVVANALQTLKKQGVVRIESGIWYLVSQGPDSRRASDSNEKIIIGEPPVEYVGEPQTETEYSTRLTTEDLQEGLLERIRSLSPQGFERLIGIILRAFDFRQVKVTGRSHDGGIDGTFENPIVCLQLAFQAKRYGMTNIVRAPAIREFRGALVASQQAGGIFITTSSFTDEAEMESVLPGPKIALLDGLQFVDLLIQKEIGVKPQVMTAALDDQFFLSI